MNKLKKLLSSLRGSFIVLLRALLKIENAKMIILIFSNLDIV
jgi:hypothetical protein